MTNNLPILFVIGALIFSLSFMISSFPLEFSSWDEQEVKKVYFADAVGYAHAQLIDTFNERYAGQIEVVPIDLPFEKFNTNQRKELIARNLRSRSSRIDVFSVDLIWVPRFTRWAEPLSPYFPPQMLNQLVPNALETCYVDGHLVAIPLYLDVGVMYYRQDIIRDLPGGEQIERRIRDSISWEELIELRDKYFRDQPFYLFQGAPYEGLICNYNEVLGVELQDPLTGGIVDVSDPRMVERLAFMRYLIHPTGISPPEVLSLTEDACIRYALQEDIPFVRGWPTINNEVEKRFDPVKFPLLRVAPLPHFEGEDYTPVFGGWNLMLSQHSPVKEEAITFMTFAASRLGQQHFIEAATLLPVLQELYVEDSTDTRLQYLNTMMQSGLHRPKHEKYTMISDVLAHQLHAVLAGDMGAQEGLDLAQEQITEILENHAIHGEQP